VKTAGDLGRKSAEFFADFGRAAVERDGSFSAALSGGSTPVLIYRALVRPDLRVRVPWQNGGRSIWFVEEAAAAELE
jgi:6-phosphogluconolactonase/glucosamine-6-phosphate isomerase/deaminase